MKRILTVLVLFISISVFAQSKYPSKKVAEAFLTRTLIVEIDDDYGSEYNTLLKEVFQEWDLTAVQFKSEAEVEEIVKSKSEDYAILSSGNKVKEKIIGNSKMLEFKVFSIAIYLSEKGSKRNKKFLDKSGEKSIARGPYVYNVSLLEKPTSKEDVEFALREMEKNIPLTLDKDKKTIIETENKEKIKILVGKTLLIPEEVLNLSASEVKSELTHNHDIKSIEEINELVAEKSKEHTYLKLVFAQDIPSYSFAIVDIETGRILDEIPTLMTSFASLNAKSKTSLGKREIKAFEKLITYKKKKYKI